jgi:hypothetical protein
MENKLYAMKWNTVPITNTQMAQLFNSTFAKYLYTSVSKYGMANTKLVYRNTHCTVYSICVCVCVCGERQLDIVIDLT